MGDKQKALAAVILSALAGSATAAITKIGLNDLPPFAFVFWRFVIASIVILPFIKVNKIIPDSIKLLPVSLFFTANIFFFIIGIGMTTATVSQVLYAGTPFIISAILFFLLKEKIKSSTLLGIVIGFLGVAFIIFLPAFFAGKFSGNILGNIIISGGVISTSFFLIRSRSALKKYSPLTITAANILTTALISIPFFLWEVRSGHNKMVFNPESAGAVIYVAVATTVVAYILNQYAIKKGGSIFASMLYYLNPLFSYFWAALLLGEKLNSGIIIGGLLILFGVFVVTSKK